MTSFGLLVEGVRSESKRVLNHRPQTRRINVLLSHAPILQSIKVHVEVHGSIATVVSIDLDKQIDKIPLYFEGFQRYLVAPFCQRPPDVAQGLLVRPCAALCATTLR